MKTKPRLLLGLVTFGLLIIGSFPLRAAEGPYHFLKEIPVGGQGGWDYLFVDSPAQRLYVSHATMLAVIDLSKDRKAGEIADTPGVHGFAVAPELQRGFSSNGRENKVSIVDLKTLQTISKVDAGENPDAILYEPNQKEVYAFNGRSQSATVIAADTGKVVATIALPGKPEFAACDPKAGRIYDNLEDKNAVAVIDTRKHEVVATWPIAPGESASGMAIDLEHHRLFLGCDNRMMVMIDSTTGRVAATVPIGSRVDANCFDPATQLAFSSNGEGNVTIAHEDSPDKLTVVQTLQTEQGAKTMVLDPATHKIYLGTAKFEPAQSGKRPAPIPGSFRILVYGMDRAPAPL
ncbi:MAG: YncE family protein [Verrucomicrobiota bacterium]|jgi:DNA-binding beta-propeller fold protein YncE